MNVLDRLNTDIAENTKQIRLDEFKGETNAYLDTAFGLRRVSYVRSYDWWAVTNNGTSSWDDQSFACTPDTTLYIIDTERFPLAQWDALFAARRDAVNERFKNIFKSA